MNELNNQPGKQPNGSADSGHEAAALERDVLISRLVDAEDAAMADAAWKRLEQIAAADPTVWRDLAVSQRQHGGLSKAVNEFVRIADEIELPTKAHPGQRPARSHTRQSGGSYSLSRWSGWAVAAVLSLAWGGAMWGNLNGRIGGNDAGSGTPQMTAGNAPGTTLADWQPKTHQEAINKYLEVGQRTGNVIGEVPQVVMIETRPARDGKGVEVFFLRQFMERAVVPDVYQMGVDEQGRMYRVPISTTKPGGKM